VVSADSYEAAYLVIKAALRELGAQNGHLEVLERIPKALEPALETAKSQLRTRLPIAVLLRMWSQAVEDIRKDHTDAARGQSPPSAPSDHPQKRWTAEDQPYLAEAVSWCFLAQYCREDGPSRAGALQDENECRAYAKELKELETTGDVTRVAWVNLTGWATTPQGSAAAREILQTRLDKNHGRIRTVLDEMPPRLARFLLEAYIIAERENIPNEALAVQVEHTVGQWTDYNVLRSETDATWCLLRDPKVLADRNRLLRSLYDAGLAVKAHSYVSTNGGRRSSDQIYVLGPGILKDFAEDYLSGLWEGQLWSPDVEDRHLLYHILKHIGVRNLRQDVVALGIPVRLRDELGDFVRSCGRDGLLKQSKENPAEGWLECTDPAAYEEVLKTRYYDPMVKYLLGRQR
jgi:hypothetical protein